MPEDTTSGQTHAGQRTIEAFLKDPTTNTQIKCAWQPCREATLSIPERISTNADKRDSVGKSNHGGDNDRADGGVGNAGGRGDSHGDSHADRPYDADKKNGRDGDNDADSDAHSASSRLTGQTRTQHQPEEQIQQGRFSYA